MVPMTGNKLSVPPKAMERLTSVYTPMGITAKNVAKKFGITREQQDAFALNSQKKASAAIEKKIFEKEIIPVNAIRYVGNEKKTFEFKVDELPRPDTTYEKLAELGPSFAMMGKQFGLDALTKDRYPHVEKIDHIHHAGNSSGIVDGATALIVASKEKGQALGLKPRAKIRAVGLCGTDPVLMLAGPMPASRKALKQAKMDVKDIDLFEVNEAFAAVPLAFMKELGVPHDKVNVNGGAIALGHPLGATGAMLLGTVLDALEDRNLSTGLVTLCIGGGMGIATIVERV